MSHYDNQGVFQNFNFKRVFAIAKKEFYHIFRDKFTFLMALVLPLVIVFIFGVAIEFNPSEIQTAVVDQDSTQSSRALLNTFSGSDYFRLNYAYEYLAAQEMLESEKVIVIIFIPSKLEHDLLSNHQSQVQVIVNAADNQTAGGILSYLADIKVRANQELFHTKIKPVVQLKTRFLFNPELNSKWFTVPGLMVIIMTMIAILLTALTIAREWESGSMELLLSTPVRPLEIIIGKIAPYAVLCLFAVLIVYVLARFIFLVPFMGNFGTYLLGCVLFLATYLAQGLMISVLTRKQMLAMQFSMLSGLIPSMLLSGFIFPIENMPLFFEKLTMILPARWFMEISRQTFLQGATFWQMRSSFLALFLLMIFFVTVALKKFKKDLEP